MKYITFTSNKLNSEIKNNHHKRFKSSCKLNKSLEMKLRFTLKVVWLLFVKLKLRFEDRCTVNVEFKLRKQTHSHWETLLSQPDHSRCFQELFWLPHNGATQREPNNQTNQTQRQSPGFSHSSPRGARPVNAHSETPNPPAESEQTTMQKAPRLWISSHPVPLLPGPDKASWSGGTAMAFAWVNGNGGNRIPYTTTRDTMERGNTDMERTRKNETRTDSKRLSSFSKSWAGKWTL